jgi:glycosyltransferase involved in cell wall biosynthesis
VSRVSVIVPVRDGERYLEEALASVLGQGHADLEVIVVDDGSTDATPAILANADGRVRSVRRPPSGLSAALNHGIELASGDLLGFIDADDLWTPGRLALQLAAFERDPGLDVVRGLVQQFRSPELTPAERAAIVCSAVPEPGMLRGAMLIRREAHARVGPSDPRWTLGEFIDWQARAEDAGLRALMLPDVVLRRRLHTTNSTRLAGDHRVDYVRIAREAIHRRRAGA